MICGTCSQVGVPLLSTREISVVVCLLCDSNLLLGCVDRSVRCIHLGLSVTDLCISLPRSAARVDHRSNEKEEAQSRNASLPNRPKGELVCRIRHADLRYQVVFVVTLVGLALGGRSELIS